MIESTIRIDYGSSIINAATPFRRLNRLSTFYALPTTMLFNTPSASILNLAAILLIFSALKHPSVSI